MDRAPELLFQPSMMGVDQSGIAETIDFVLKKFPSHQQDAMTKVTIVGTPI